MKITKETKVLDAVKNLKSSVKVFNKYNLDCPGCKGAVEDTIEKVAINNGLDLEKFINELNAIDG